MTEIVRVFGIVYVKRDGFVIAHIPREGEQIERRPLRPLAVREHAPKTSAGGGYRDQVAA